MERAEGRETIGNEQSPRYLNGNSFRRGDIHPRFHHLERVSDGMRWRGKRRKEEAEREEGEKGDREERSDSGVWN